jgi:hypothetical protein
VVIFVGVEERVVHSSPQPHVRVVGEELHPYAGAFVGADGGEGVGFLAL